MSEAVGSVPADAVGNTDPGVRVTASPAAPCRRVRMSRFRVGGCERLTGTGGCAGCVVTAGCPVGVVLWCRSATP